MPKTGNAINASILSLLELFLQTISNIPLEKNFLIS
jgi:hypothetical protein